MESKLDIPEFLQDDRLPWLKWVQYKGKECVADVDYQKSIKAHRPIINIHYCMTKAMNGKIEKTVNFNPDFFKPSKLG